MTVLRCTAKLLKQLKQPAKATEPEAQDNPLGEWYADLDVWCRQPFVVMLNGATGAVLVLPANAAELRRLHERAQLQFASLCAQFRLQSPEVDAELNGFGAGFTFGPARDRSLMSSLNQRKFEVWMSLEHADSPAQIAARLWEGLFQHPALGREARSNSKYHRPLDLVRQRLMPSASMLPFNTTQP